METNRNNISRLRITPSIHPTRDINLTQTFNKIKANIDLWSSLPTSLWGRVNIVKMNILPNVNYILRMLPVKIQKAWFDVLRKAIPVFIRRGKKARCSYLRMSPTEKVGCSFPTFITISYHLVVSM